MKKLLIIAAAMLACSAYAVPGAASNHGNAGVRPSPPPPMRMISGPQYAPPVHSVKPRPVGGGHVPVDLPPCWTGAHPCIK